MGEYNYVVPVNQFDKAVEIRKVIRVGQTLGFVMRRDIVNALRLKRGQLVKLTIELIPHSEIPEVTTIVKKEE